MRDDNDQQPSEDNSSTSAPTPFTTENLVPPPIQLYPQWHNAVAGAVAGASARVATAPLDLIRIRAQLEREVTYPRPSLFQKLKTIYQQEGGFIALFRGNLAATYLWIGYSAVQFSAYGKIKDRLNEQRQSSEQESIVDTTNSLLNPQFWLTSTSIAFLAGAGAGICATVSTYPFDICRTVFAAQGVTVVHANSSATAASSFQPPKSLWECATRMYHQQPIGRNNRGGLAAFFVGVRPAVVQIIPYMGLNFAIYDSLTQGDRRIGLSGYAGSISGAVSKMIVYPCDTIKKRIQYQSVFGNSSVVGEHYYKGMWDCLITMIRTEGISSLYRGLVPSVLKTTIGSGLSFTFFRMTKNGLEELHDYRFSRSTSSAKDDNDLGIT
ncbi:mitochondrial carrier protein [Nitzschia inconspicua]|uniref:Mitochondrial carrier protein n=1 Tax=Nitzschia inconspicua TaxID=303405 RepID=A0A9K3KJB1_9STRA|nr:mitochondrial carrier protein [Nitzschia inconspicua]